MTECEYSSYVVYYVTSLANALYYPIIQSALWCGNVATLAVEAPKSFSRIFNLDKCDMQ